jgi:uncharacterized iron-regulated membrane protein
MLFRRVIFWIHLVAGVISAISIGIMCFTGTVLAFEKQLVAWSERDARLIPTEHIGQTRLTIDELETKVRSAYPEARPAAIIVPSDPRQAITFSLGRDQNVFANPYTGAVVQPASTSMHDFMHVMVDWHRYLALTGEQRPTGKLINGICNLAFFALAVTGLYLWIPRQWSWASVRAVSLFNGRLTGRGRDFNWHNVIGLWSAPVLIVLTLTAVPISFRWGSNLVYKLVGETPPVAQGPGANAGPGIELPPPAAETLLVPRQKLFTRLQSEFPQAEQITLRLSTPNRNTSTAPRSAPTEQRTGGQVENSVPRVVQPLNFTIRSSGTWPRTATTSVMLNPYTGDVVRREGFADLSTGRQVRSWTRFLHTGEALGWGGQLVAGLASFGGCVLVYTGLALAWRRFFGGRTKVSEKPVSPTQDSSRILEASKRS